MKTLALALALLVSLLYCVVVQAQESRFSVQIQASTYLHNAAGKAEIPRSPGCTFGACLNRTIRFSSIKRYVQQFSLAYRLSPRWSVESGLIYNQYEIERYINTPSTIPDNRREVITYFRASQLPIQLNYQVDKVWRLALGYRLHLGPKPAKLDDNFRFPPTIVVFSDLSTSVAYVQTHFGWPLAKNLRLTAFAQANYEDRIYLGGDLQLEGGLGISFQL